MAISSFNSSGVIASNPEQQHTPAPKSSNSQPLASLSANAISNVGISSLLNGQSSAPIEESAAPSTAVTQRNTKLAITQEEFPDQPRKGSNTTPATLDNLAYMLDASGIGVRYNVMTKRVKISVPGVISTPDNTNNVAIANVMSLANLNGLPTGQIMGFLGAIGDKHQFNPVVDWITSKPWDGVDRLATFYDTLVQREDFPIELKQALMYRWMLSTVAAVLKPSGFKARGVLTLQGPQSIGKTSWISALVPDPVLREGVLKLDHHLDAGNKDSIIAAVCHWLVEIGELDSSFKKDIARLKGFLTSDRDKVRKPYDRTESEYPRRTVFCATVNEHDFLIDSTGNSRWWTIPVTSINYQHGIDMQQLFAQLTIDFHGGAQWWLTRDEEQLLELQNKDHRKTSAIRERILGALDFNRINDAGLSAMASTQLLQKLDIKNPTNMQCKECAGVLREYLGDPKKIQGQYKWRIPFRKDDFDPLLPVHDDDEF